MENNIESTIGVAEEVMEGAVKTTGGSGKTLLGVVIGCAVIGGAVAAVISIRKRLKANKSIVDGKILGVEEPEEEK